MKAPRCLPALATLGLLTALFATSCAPGAVNPSALRTTVTDYQVRAGSAKAVSSDVKLLLSRPLTAEAAAQIALLNNRNVEAVMEQVNVAEGQLSEAKRLPNPTFEGAVLFGGEGRAELELGAMIDLTDLLVRVPRSDAAQANLDAAKLETIGSLLDLSYDTRRAFYAYQATSELLELRKTITQSFGVALELAVRLREAGNITELELASQRGSFDEARLELQRAESDALAAREGLNAMMGLWGDGTDWQTEPRLPAIPETELPLASLESTSVERSLDLAVVRERFAAAAERANAARVEGWVPEIAAGVSAERGEKWGVGPAVELSLPLFYQGQGAIGSAEAEMRRQRHLHTSLAVELRASARSAGTRLLSTREASLHYESVLLPLKQQVLEQTQLEYNAMLVGLFQLLQAKRDQVGTAAAHTDQRRDYWLARTDVEQLLAGRMPGARSRQSSSRVSPQRASGSAAH